MAGIAAAGTQPVHGASDVAQLGVGNLSHRLVRGETGRVADLAATASTAWTKDIRSGSASVSAAAAQIDSRIAW